jgi:hypothetical protein
VSKLASGDTGAAARVRGCAGIGACAGVRADGNGKELGRVLASTGTATGGVNGRQRYEGVSARLLTVT